MKWLVYIDDYYTHKSISNYNIFDHYRFKEDCDNAYKECKGNKEEFEKRVKRDLAYYFWSKCEWEIVISGWPPWKDFKEKKISVYDQVLLNWDIFIDYLWREYVTGK